MPELPEVETIRRDLAASLYGRRVTGVRVYHDDLILGGTSRRTFQRSVRGREIGRLQRRAKHLLFSLHPPGDLEGVPEWIMRVQLRMTGQFALGVRRPDGKAFRHPGIDLALDDGRTLFYDDVRRLGGFDLFTPDGWAAQSARLGPEPLAAEFTAGTLERLLAHVRAPLKNALLDQRRLAGIGNIYASEALHRAGIDPRRPGGSLSRVETQRLHRAIRAVLRAALEKSGTTVRDYRTVNGGSGSFQHELRVYGREGGRCRRCGAAVSRIVQAGRSSFFCGSCQR